MMRILKTIACMTTLSVCTALIPKINTEAASVGPVPGSDFQYDLTAKIVDHAFKIGDTQIYAGDVAVTFEVTNNPGMTSYSTKLVFDDRYELISYEAQHFNVSQDAYNRETNTFVYAAVNSNTFGEFTDEFSNVFYFRPNESLSYTTGTGFQMTLLSYRSEAENISYSVNANTSSPDKIVRGQVRVNFILGDINGDGIISVDDASNTSFLAARSQYLIGSTSIKDINTLLYNDEILRSKLPNLICADVADANLNGFIEQEEDTQAILDYYANHGTGNPVSGVVGNKITRTFFL